MYKFDKNCEFKNITPNDLISDIREINRRSPQFKINNYTIKINPCTVINFEDNVGETFENVLNNIFTEISEDINESIKYLFELYDDEDLGYEKYLNTPIFESLLENLINMILFDVQMEKDSTLSYLERIKKIRRNE